MSAPCADTVITDNGAGSIADRMPILLAAMGAACISASAVLIKLADTGTATVAFYRCLLAMPVLAAVAIIERRRHGPRQLAAHRGAILAGLFLAIDLVLWNHAIAEVGAGIATVLGNLQVLFVAVAAWALFWERPGRRFLLALPVVLAGVVLVSGLPGGASGGGRPLAGVGYGMATSVAYAGFLLVLRRTSACTPHIAGPLADATASAAAGSLVLGLAFGGLPLEIDWPSFGWLLLLSLTSGTIGWLLITSSLPRLPAAISSLTLLLQPAAAMLLAAAVLGEYPSIVQLAGAVLVCCGVLAASRTTSRAAAKAATPHEAGPPARERAASARGRAASARGRAAAASDRRDGWPPGAGLRRAAAHVEVLDALADRAAA
jgi:drug/metabolite transporter (DMT)-like permease